MQQNRKQWFRVLGAAFIFFFIFPAKNAHSQKVAVWRIDALGGLSKKVVTTLESLLTQELARIADEVIPSAKTIALQQRNRRLRKCEGNDRCLAALGRHLNVRYVITGNLAALGNHYVVTLKLVDSAERKAIRSISEPLSGEAEQLIETVRVAAYRLLDPQALLGSLRIMVNQTNAKIFVDGKFVGKSPLRSPVSRLKIGKHSLKITHDDFLDLAKTVDVRFQKTTTVKVNLVKPQETPQPFPDKPVGPITRDHPTPFYSKWWFWTAVGVGAAALGATAGWAIGRILEPSAPTVLNCDSYGEGCN